MTKMQRISVRKIGGWPVYRYYYAFSEKLKQHLQAFLNAYNFAKQLKTLQGLTPYEFIQNYWTNHPEKFKINPSHLNMKPYKIIVSVCASFAYTEYKEEELKESCY